ncbi:hypothetical protein QBC34DRAFT_356297 [Podospora aff. communis PSN243]|uniref:Tyrosinase copper-binding domain-containing protein n=1 Tax=Podospora aff. communis PSN243 TaxID=3040156 RepID=A0AAV9GH02_9PEZI|nr:hypothetical protein QBC34DRAFT_356297 [Podospora aff. communis PSN243]
MKFLQIASLATATLALPLDEGIAAHQTTSCTSPKVRKSWAAATDAEKRSYIDAVLCLPTKPSRLNIATHDNLYDDFGYIHAKLSAPQRIHGEPVFLPWHRYFVQVYEDALHECGYTGAAMYWDWVADSGAPASAAVWDPVLGFGGNGSATSENGEGKWRVVDGPFRNLRPTYWNVTDTPDPHYLSRDFFRAIPEANPPYQEMLGWQYNQDVMDTITPIDNYLNFRIQLESRPHGVVHSAIGGSRGDMGPNTSPNDPIFFLHHTMVDKIWWQWQQHNPQTRTLAYEGTRNDGAAASLDDIMPMLGLAEDKVVRDYMDTQGGALCYTY